MGTVQDNKYDEELVQRSLRTRAAGWACIHKQVYALLGAEATGMHLWSSRNDTAVSCARLCDCMACVAQRHDKAAGSCHDERARLQLRPSQVR